jgi:hypothetical protein
MIPGDRVLIQWERSDDVYEVTYLRTERGFFMFRSDDENVEPYGYGHRDKNIIVARKDSLSRCEVKEDGNEQRNLRETPETILSGTI